MSDVVLKAVTRKNTGTKVAKDLRREGRVPGIYYGHKEKNVILSLDLKELVNVITMETGLLDLKIDKKKEKKCIIKDIQFDPISNRPIHVDVMGVNLTEKITVSVPVHIIGSAIGVKDEGGILNVVQHEISVSCLPLDLPDNIEVDVTDLNIGDSVHIKEITIDKVEILNDPEVVIVSVVIPRALKEEKPEELEELEGEEGEGEGDDADETENTDN